MPEERKAIRLMQVARTFNVGVQTIMDFLEKKGVRVDSPNAKVDAAAMAILQKEYGGTIQGNERQKVQEKISGKMETVSIDDMKSQGRQDDDFRGSRLISVKEEISSRNLAPKVLGKIDIDGQRKDRPKAEESRVEQEHGAPAAASVSEPAQETPAPAPKPAPAPAPEPTPAPAPAVMAAAEPESRPEPKAAPSDEVRETATAQAPEKTEQTQTSSAERPASEAEHAERPRSIIQEKTYDERMAESRDDVFRANDDQNRLTGPVVLGKLDISELDKRPSDHSRREKRKRIGKDKVDITKANVQAPAKGRDQQRPGDQRQRPMQQGQQPLPGRKDRTRKKQAAKPVLHTEVNEEEVQKQIKDTLARLTSKNAKSKGSIHRREKRQEVRAQMEADMIREQAEQSILKVTEFVTVSELASMMNVPVTDVITACMNLGLMVSINQRLDAEALVIVAEEFDFKVEFVSAEVIGEIDEEKDSEEDLLPRPPIVTVMGHVDHGKTSLLDNIRKTNVIEGEAGGITQHIGAYSVNLDGRKITFLDTPGHEAFTAMRARGAKITDVAIIIVAADDNVMPQTTEAINHAVAAGVPMVFAINKIDKPHANPEHIKEQLANMNFLVEDWGGKYQSQDISAKQGINLDKLLEKVLLEADLLELKANPNRKAVGSVIESSLDKGRGYVATVMVQNGTLHIGDIILSGVHSGRVKAMFDENGRKVTSAGPSTPVQVLGLNGAPQAGDTFNVMDDDRSAREIANKREQLQRIQGLKTQKHLTLEDIARRIAIGNFKELNIIVKGDVDGSIEAMTDSLLKLSKEEVQVNVIHKAVGQISESDVLLAAASNAVIVGFQVRPSASAKKLAEKEEIEIRLYSIIYDAINDIKDAIEGMLEPVMKEEIVCSIEVLEIFKISKVGTIAGGVVREGKLSRNTPVRIIRDGIVIHSGKLGSLKRFKDDVKEVVSGQECGLNIESFNDVRQGDIIEGYESVQVSRS